MSENERVKEVRKALSLTMRQFGERLGLGSSTISDIENGRRNLTTQNRLSICREFGINENWLISGEGNMMTPDPESEIEALAMKYPQMTNETLVLIKKLVKLPREKQDIISDFLREVVAGFEAPALTPEQEIEEKVANYRKQLLEEKNMASQDFSRSSNDEDGNYETA